ncbi:MAG: ATP-binding cassette domain-containing protein [Clostridia bacterium]|nr:ATP-binding cassette domain-containing protein [Clostridia bacterium]MDD4665264.1 ATP-binding cassette domain-containing protein [Clostridia bacterium]
MAFIKVEDLTYYYPETETPALEKINLSLNRGEFVLVLGSSGCGKSSLVRALAGLLPDFYGGRFGGRIYLENQEIRTIKRSALVKKVGMVFQDPESQLIMSSVEQELVLGMENLGLPVSLMKRRLMEVGEAFALSPYLQQRVTQLSGGLQQKVVLASILAMQPEILILDEPTSQLDPVAGEEILTTVRKLNEDQGMTVILIEQRLERCFHLADRVVVMEKGRIVQNQTNLKQLVVWAVKEGSPFLPPLPKLFARSGFTRIPLTVKEGRGLLSEETGGRFSCLSAEAAADQTGLVSRSQKKAKKPSPSPCLTGEKELLLQVENVAYTYENGVEALKEINLELYAGDFLVLMGENAAGKTTLLKNTRGLLQPTKGTVRFLGQELKTRPIEEWAGEIGYLSQYPGDYLFLPTVREEIEFTLDNLHLPKGVRVDLLLEKLGLTKFAESYARDLSSGERQRVALAAVLAADPKLIILDEPTRGLDYELKAHLGEILQNLQKEGRAILLVTHDVEFAAEYAAEIALMTQGTIIAKGSKEEMLSDSAFFSPQVAKLFGGLCAEPVVTLAQGKLVLEKIWERKEEGRQTMRSAEGAEK